jgi:hypothetical protein
MSKSINVGRLAQQKYWGIPTTRQYSITSVSQEQTHTQQSGYHWWNSSPKFCRGFIRSKPNPISKYATMGRQESKKCEQTSVPQMTNSKWL